MQRLRPLAGAVWVRDHVTRLSLLYHSEPVRQEPVEAFDERRTHLEQGDYPLYRLQLSDTMLMEVGQRVEELSVHPRRTRLLHLSRRGIEIRETTWTNTGATWSGRLQHKTGDGMLRPFSAQPRDTTVAIDDGDSNHKVQMYTFYFKPCGSSRGITFFFRRLALQFYFYMTRQNMIGQI